MVVVLIAWKHMWPVCSEFQDWLVPASVKELSHLGIPRIAFPFPRGPGSGKSTSRFPLGIYSPCASWIRKPFVSRYSPGRDVSCPAVLWSFQLSCTLTTGNPGHAIPSLARQAASFLLLTLPFLQKAQGICKGPASKAIAGSVG